MGASPFPYFDAREKILERQAQAAEALKQRQFQASENAKQRAQQASQFEQTFGLNRKKTAASINYMNAMAQNIEDQKNKYLLDIDRGITSGDLVETEPGTPGAHQIAGRWIRAANPTEKTKQAIASQKMLEEAETLDFKDKAMAAIKAGLVPKEYAPLLAVAGPKIGQSLIISALAPRLNPQNMYQFISGMTAKLANGQVNTKDFVSTLGLLQQIHTMTTAPPGTLEYYKLRNTQLEAKLKQAEVLPKVSYLVSSAVKGINPKDPKYHQAVVDAVTGLVKSGKIKQDEAGIFLYDFLKRTNMNPLDAITAFMQRFMGGEGQ